MRTARSRPSSAEPAEPEPTDRGPAPEAPVASLEQALEFIRDDEAVEVTPESIRLRKVELSGTKRQTQTSRRKREAGVS